MISFLNKFRSGWQKFYMNIAFLAKFLKKTGNQNLVYKKIKTKIYCVFKYFPSCFEDSFFPLAFLNHLTK